MTTYRAGSTSKAECFGPILSINDEAMIYNISRSSGIKRGDKIKAVSGDWLLRDVIGEELILRQGDEHEVRTNWKVSEVYPLVPNFFCYKKIEKNGARYIGYRNMDKNGNKCDDGMSCRNTDGEEDEPYCMVNGEKSACGIPECIWDISCYEGLGAGYRGEVAKTKEGYTCQRWDKEWPHFSLFPPNKHNAEAYGIGHDNLCRNPDPRQTDKLWCYTTSIWKRSDACPVKRCDESVPYFK